MSASLKAFYILFAEQILSPQWPALVCQNAGKGPQGGECVDPADYALFVASPQNVTADLIASVKDVAPGSKVVMYWDFGDAPLPHSAECPFCHGHIMGDRDGRNCSTTYACGPSPFLDELWDVFPNELAVRDVTNGTSVLVESYPGLAKYVWTSETAARLAAFLGNWSRDHGFDGVYLDGYMEPSRVDFDECDTPEEGCASFMIKGHSYDIDGDGVAESSAEVYASYFAWAPAFVALLRDTLGDGGVILANSAGSQSDACPGRAETTPRRAPGGHPPPTRSLSGLTLEMESCTSNYGGSGACGDALAGQRAVTEVAGREAVSVMWLTHSAGAAS